MAERRRRPVGAVLAGLVMTAGLVTLATPASAADRHHCDEKMERVSRLSVSDGTSCDRARGVARRFDHKVTSGSEWPSADPLMVRGFACSADKTGYETYRVRCIRGDRTVRFNWGV